MHRKKLFQPIFLLLSVFIFYHSLFSETITLRSGKAVEGKIIEKTDQYIKIDFYGVELTYFLDEIDSIDGVTQSLQSIDNKGSIKGTPPYFEEGLKYALAGNFIDAEEQFKKDLKTKSPDPDSQICLDFLDLYQEARIKKEVIISTFKGLECVIKGEYEQSLPYFQEALNEYPDFVFPNYLTGCVYAALGQFQPAINYLENAIKINPRALDIYNKLGILYDAIGQPNTALVYLQKAIDIDPNYAGTYANLGKVLIGIGQYEDAFNNLQKALGIDSNCIDAYIGLGIFYLNSNKPQEAITYYEKSLKSLQLKQIPDRTQYAEIYGGLGHAYCLLGQNEKAKDYLLKSIEKNPNFALSYLNLASIQVLSGEKTEAKKNLEKARELFLRVGDYQRAKKTEDYIKRLP